MSRFGTFWHGAPLSGFEAACLHSFVARGHEVTLFSFEPIGNVPEGVRCADAASIAPREKIGEFIVAGKASISHFSDFFRYRMFAATELVWIDTDLLLLRSWEQPPEQNLLALETPTSICNAVMRVASAEPWLADLILRADALRNTNMRHGDTGPRLITKLVGQGALLAQARSPAIHFPIHFDDFWKVFLPAHRDECRALCREALTLHLWNNIVERLGFWKEYLPPSGSYLHESFVDAGCEQFFRGVFPEANMAQLVENWQSRQTGRHLGVRSVVRQLVPSLGRTCRHYLGSGH